MVNTFVNIQYSRTGHNSAHGIASFSSQINLHTSSSDIMLDFRALKVITITRTATPTASVYCPPSRIQTWRSCNRSLSWLISGGFDTVYDRHSRSGVCTQLRVRETKDLVGSGGKVKLFPEEWSFPAFWERYQMA